MSLATAEIGCTVSPPLSGAMEDCSIVRGPQLQRLCRQNGCMSRQRRMFGSLWNVVVVHEHRRQDGSRRLTTSAKCQTYSTSMACGKLINGGVLSNRVLIFHKKMCDDVFLPVLMRSSNSKPNPNPIY